MSIRGVSAGVALKRQPVIRRVGRRGPWRLASVARTPTEPPPAAAPLRCLDARDRLEQVAAHHDRAACSAGGSP